MDGGKFKMGRRVTLGSTGICVNKNGFGALPVQRVEMDEACNIGEKYYEKVFDCNRLPE